MNDWLYSIITVVIIISILSIIVPEGRLGKIVKGIFSIIILLILIQPFVNTSSLDNSKFDILSFEVDDKVQYEYLDYVFTKKIIALEKETKEIIEKCGVSNSTININYQVNDEEGFQINFVNINLSNAVINSDKEHIDIIEEIRNEVSKYLKINNELIRIYE